jgi:hypothetical protein
MEKDNLTALVKQIRDSYEIRPEAIPDIELYMDQLLTFLNQHLDRSQENAGSHSFTKTMINNYTKDRLLIPPQGKKYTKQHIMLLTLIYHLKGILSINAIKSLFGPILRDINTPDDDLIPLEDIYTTYLNLTDNYLDEFSENFANKLSFITSLTSHLEGEAKNTARLFLSVLILIAQADLSKKVAEVIIESYFSAQAANTDEQRMAFDIDLDNLFGKTSKKTE